MFYIGIVLLYEDVYYFFFVWNVKENILLFNEVIYLIIYLLDLFLIFSI